MQIVDVKLVEKRKIIQQGDRENFSINKDNCLRFRNQISILDNIKLKQFVLLEAHDGPFTMHHGGQYEKGNHQICCKMFDLPMNESSTSSSL